MTSKEALQRLQIELYRPEDDYYETQKALNYIDIIEKDLEVLEILKPIIKACIRVSDYGVKTRKLALNIKADKLLKEWLEK